MAPIHLTRPLPDDVSYVSLFRPKSDPLTNQGPYGACVLFATAAMFEALLKKHHGVDITISRRAAYWLTQYLYEHDNLGQDDGTYAADALQVLRDHGHVLNSVWPYPDPNAPAEPLDQFFASVPPADVVPSWEIGSYVRVGGSESGSGLVELLEKALYTHGPVAIGVSWANEWMEPGPDGVLAPHPTQGVAGGHEIVAAGYSRGKRAFLIGNNWGADWGIQDTAHPELAGYAWMSYDSVVDPTYGIGDAYTIAV
jgi:C1A family cysteine protease